MRYVGTKYNCRCITNNRYGLIHGIHKYSISSANLLNSINKKYKKDLVKTGDRELYNHSVLVGDIEIDLEVSFPMLEFQSLVGIVCFSIKRVN